MKVVRLLVGSSLLTLAVSQAVTVNRVHTTYINGEQGFGGAAAFQQQPIAVPPFQTIFQAPAPPSYAQTVQPIRIQQNIVPIGHANLPIEVRSAPPILHQQSLSPVEAASGEGNTRVFTFQTDPYNQFRLLQRDEPPHIEQVAIKNPKVNVIDIQKPPNPSMVVYQVKREPNPPATVEFVNEAPPETQVTVLDDTDSSVRVEHVGHDGASSIEPRHQEIEEPDLEEEVQRAPIPRTPILRSFNRQAPAYQRQAYQAIRRQPSLRKISSSFDRRTIRNNY